MAYDEGLAEALRSDLNGVAGSVTEKQMFGGICFLLNGNMLCGVHSGGAMYRVGKPHQEAACAMPGVGPMAFTGRPMGGMVEVTDSAMAEDATRDALLRLAIDFVAPMPAK